MRGMSVADIFNIPTTDAELATWSTLHMILHRGENRAVFEQFNVLLTEFILDPIDPSPNSAWFQQHQTMHNNIDALVGVAQFDLIDVDWTNAAQRAGWFQGHAQLHRQETDALEVFS